MMPALRRDAKYEHEDGVLDVHNQLLGSNLHPPDSDAPDIESGKKLPMISLGMFGPCLQAADDV